MHIKKYIKMIVENGRQEDMEELSNILDETINIIKEYNEDLYDKYKMCLYKMAYGNNFDKDMAEDIIRRMKPYGMRFGLEDSQQIQNQFGFDNIDPIDFWIVLNSAYNDYRDLFEDNIEMYARYVRDFIEDEDAKNDKVFLYYTTIPNKEKGEII